MTFTAVDLGKRLCVADDFGIIKLFDSLDDNLVWEITAMNRGKAAVSSDTLRSAILRQRFIAVEGTMREVR